MGDRDDRIQREAENYRVMGELLTKHRAPREAESVRNVLESEAPLEEKIRRIRAIDLNGSAVQDVPAGKPLAAVPESPSPARKNPPASDVLRSQPAPAFETGPESVERIRPAIRRSGFFGFFFREYGRLQEFGTKTGLLSFRLIPPSFLLNGFTAKTILSAAFRDAAEVLPLLRFIQERGWLTMEKFDYNLVSLFCRFCEILLGMRNGGGGQGEFFLRSLQSAENLWLACHYRNDYPSKIAAGIEDQLKRYPERERVAVSARESVLRLLAAVTFRPTVGNLLLASDMIAFRRYLELPDLLRELPGGVVGVYRFDAPLFVQQRISAWIADNARQADLYSAEKARIDRIRLFTEQFTVPLEDGGVEYDFRFIAAFFADNDAGKNNQFLRDTDDVIQFAGRFYPYLLQAFRNFLVERVELESVGTVRAFPPDFFLADVDRLTAHVARLTQNNFQCPHMERSEFLEFREKDRRHTPSSGQMGMIQILDELSGILTFIGMRASALCGRHEKPDIPLSFNGENAQACQSDIDTVFWDKRIVSAGYLRGKTFGQALYTFTTLVFLGALYFRNAEILGTLDRSYRVEQSLEKSLRALKRVADPAAFEQIRSRCCAD